MRTHPDADAFMRSYLEQPADATARLVFADWLEETGEPHNTAWAHYIRLKVEAARHDPDSVECGVLTRRADDLAPDIRAQLTISAKKFVGYPKSLLQLLPGPNITVRLARFEVPLAIIGLVPESVARENLVIAIDEQERMLFIASAEPHNAGTRRKLEFILNCAVIVVRADREDIQRAIDHAHGQVEYEHVDTEPLPYFTSPPSLLPLPGAGAPEWIESDDPAVRLVNLLLQESINLHADRILLYPDIDALGVRYHINGEWTECDRDRISVRLLRRVTIHIAIAAGIDLTTVFGHLPSPDALVGEVSPQVRGLWFRVRVTIQPSPDGPTTQLDLHRSPEPHL